MLDQLRGILYLFYVGIEDVCFAQLGLQRLGKQTHLAHVRIRPS